LAACARRAAGAARQGAALLEQALAFGQRRLEHAQQAAVRQQPEPAAALVVHRLDCVFRTSNGL
jgi:hypothetical protein